VRPKLHAIEIIVVLILTVMLAGCGFLHAKHEVESLPAKFQPPVPPTRPTMANPVGKAPSAFKHVDDSLEWFIILGIMGITASAVVFFLAPQLHRISTAIAGGAGTLLALSLILKVTFWLIPWLVYSAIALAFAALAYEVWVHYIRYTPPASK
jgi:hypothetical protein